MSSMVTSMFQRIWYQLPLKIGDNIETTLCILEKGLKLGNKREV